jgi:hypothetical protein
MMGIGKDTWTQARENIAVSAMIASARAAIVAGSDISLDNTHLVPRLPSMYRREFSPLGVTWQVHSFMSVSVDECIARDALRSDPVGEDVIRKLNDRYIGAGKSGWRLTEKWLQGETYAKPDPYVKRPDLPPVVLCDIDGTVALHNDTRGHYDYDKVSTDLPNQPVLDLVTVLTSRHVDCEVIFMSGREDRCRKDTIEWLQTHLPLLRGSVPLLFMRATGDHRPDYVVKGELFDTHIRGQYDPWLVLDDRDQVVNMWRSIGLTCLQVAKGDF